MAESTLPYQAAKRWRRSPCQPQQNSWASLLFCIVLWTPYFFRRYQIPTNHFLEIVSTKFIVHVVWVTTIFKSWQYCNLNTMRNKHGMANQLKIFSLVTRKFSQIVCDIICLYRSVCYLFYICVILSIVIQMEKKKAWHRDGGRISSIHTHIYRAD